MKDRVVQYPGRYKLTPVSGDTYDLTPQPGVVTEVGTDLNKATLLKDTTAALYGLGPEAVPDEVLGKLAGGVLYNNKSAVADLSEGDTFYLSESGQPVEYIKLKENYEGSGRTLVIRRDSYSTRAWHNSNLNAYATSDIDAWLNSTFYALLDSAVQLEIAAVTIPYTPGNGTNTTSTINRKVFLLSLTEIGLTFADSNTEGTAISYFSSASKRISSVDNGSITAWWTRSPRISATTAAFVVSTSGAADVKGCIATDVAVRPAFTLSADLDVSVPAGLTDVLGNLITIPSAQLDKQVQIAVGSYVGTGTYGASNPNSLTFYFAPKKLSIIQSFGIVFGKLIIDGSTVYGYSNTTAAGAFVMLIGSISGNTISWYNATNAANQLNTSGSAYLFVAEG